MQPKNARRTAEKLSAWLEQRRAELNAAGQVISRTPLVMGGAFIIPQGLMDLRKGKIPAPVDVLARQRMEKIAMQAVLDAEKALGHEVVDVSSQKCGWDITARCRPGSSGSIQPDRHIEIKGRSKGQSTVTESRNEILCGLNQKDKFILAIVIVDGEEFEGPYYIRNPFLGVPGVNYCLRQLVGRGELAGETL